MRERTKAGVSNLNEAAMMWSTPSSHDGRRPGNDDTSTQGRNLKREAEALNWPPPRVSMAGETYEHKKARSDKWDRPGGADLKGVAQNWPTPTPTEAPNTNANQKNMPPSLGNAAEMWSMPATDEPGLDQQARLWKSSFPLDPTTPTPGAVSSSDGPPSRQRLNPLFVSWLMGWPIWWILPLPIVLPPSGSPETAWSHYRQRLRGAYSALALGSE